MTDAAPRTHPLAWLALVLVAVAIILVIAFSGPDYRDRPPRGYVSTGIGGVLTIVAGQTDHREASPTGSYAASLEALGTEENPVGVALIDPTLASGEKNGYAFRLIPGPVEEGAIRSYSVQAWPLDQKYGPRPSFYADESGVLRGALLDGRPGGVEMPIHER